jgi:hypothetical protein
VQRVDREGDRRHHLPRHRPGCDRAREHQEHDTERTERTGGSHGYGHIAISVGGGKCWSTDIQRPGYFDLVPVTRIHDAWGLTFVGWSEDVDGVRVITVLPPTPAPVATPHIDHAINDLAEQIAAMKVGPKRAAVRAARRTTLAARRIVKGISA